MAPSDSSELQAYVMAHMKCNQLEAQAHLDRWMQHWRYEEPPQPVSVTVQIGEDDEDEYDE